MPNARKQVYRVGYKRPGAVIRPDFLPQLPHLTDGSRVLEAHVTEAGRYDDGTEFQVIRVVIQPPV